MSDNIDEMTLEQQIGQLFMVGFPGTQPSPEIIELIQQQHIGGIILFSRNIESAPQLLALTQNLQAAARTAKHPYPLLIATDQENGLVRRLGSDSTTFPGNMALGAIGSEQITYDVAHATGHELKALGVNMNLAPVVDVNNNPANPVIGIRSFGEDPQLVARLGAAAVRGYRSAGIIATLKHFPGHGDTAVDSHKALPTIPATLEQLEAVELVPFRQGIEAGADCVMIAHIFLPALMPGEPAPATISSNIVRGLLRKRLGFGGVITSDCLEMDAITHTVGTARGTVMALQAGMDLVFVSHRIERQRASIAAVRAAVASGELSAGQIREAAERVLQLKAHYLSWDSLPTPETLHVVGNAAHAQLRDRAYALSTTVARDDAGQLPLHLTAEETLLIVTRPSDTITKAVDIVYANELLVDAIRHYHEAVRVVTLPAESKAESLDDVLDAPSEAAAVILVTMNAHLDPEQQRIMRRVIAAGRPCIGIAICNPYDVTALPELSTYLVTYEYSQPALLAAVQVLFGQTQATGHAPVTLTTEPDSGQDVPNRG